MTTEPEQNQNTGNASPPENNDALKKQLEKNRSRVRIWITYAAAAFLFIGGPLLIAAFFYCGDACGSDGSTGRTTAKDLFLTILPVASSIVAYWFAGRKPDSAPNDKRGSNTK